MAENTYGLNSKRDNSGYMNGHSSSVPMKQNKNLGNQIEIRKQ